MHKFIRKWSLLLALAATEGSVFAQNASAPAGAGGQPASAPKQIARGVPLPKGDNFTIAANTSERFSVAPYRLFDAPRATSSLVTVTPLQSERANELPENFVIQTQQIGETTLVLPLIKEGEPPFERRINLLVVDEISISFKSYIEGQIRRLYPTVSVDVMVANSSTAVLTGYVDRAELVLPVEQLVRGMLASRAGMQPSEVTVVNALRVTGSQQVQLKVLIAEVDRSKIRELGFDWSWTDLSAPLTAFLGNGLGTGAGTGVGTSISPAQPFLVSRAGVYSFTGNLRALVTNQLAKIMAEPVVVGLSGQPLFFNAGGEVPVPAPQPGSGTGSAVITVTYRPFGTNVRCVPTVLGDGRIRLEVRPEISQLNPANGVVAAGVSIPGFDSRVAESTIELESGQTMVIAGLIQSRVSATANKVPVLGDIPIVGWAWQNKQYRQEETEILIMVTPHLVEAMNERPCKIPGRESRIPNNVEFFIGSKFEPPCFADPYRDHYRQHHNGEKPPTPAAEVPYDNYGRPPRALQLAPAPVAAPPAKVVELPPQAAEVKTASAEKPVSEGPVQEITLAPPPPVTQAVSDAKPAEDKPAEVAAPLPPPAELKLEPTPKPAEPLPPVEAPKATEPAPSAEEPKPASENTPKPQSETPPENKPATEGGAAEPPPPAPVVPPANPGGN